MSPARRLAKATRDHRACLMGLLVCEKLYARFNADQPTIEEREQEILSLEVRYARFDADLEARSSRRFPKQVPR